MGKDKVVGVISGFGILTALAIWFVAGFFAYLLSAEDDVVVLKSITASNLDHEKDTPFKPGDRISLSKYSCSKGTNVVSIHRSLVHVASNRLVNYAKSLEKYRDGCGNYVCELILPQYMEPGDWKVEILVEVQINHFKTKYVNAEPINFTVEK